MAILERVVSGLGEIRLTNAFRNALHIYLYVDVIRFPGNQYLNFNWEPPRSEFAKITWLYDDYVVREDTIRYPRERLTIFENQAAQNLLSLICVYDGILDSFLGLAECIIECTPISRTNLIKEHQYKIFDVNRIKFSCFNDTALRLTLRSRSLDQCSMEDGTRRGPTNSPDAPEIVPFGEPVQNAGYIISEPYPDSPESTQPNPIDDSDGEFPIGDECAIVVVDAIADSDVLNEPVAITGGVYGPLAGFEFRTEDGSVYGFDIVGQGDPRFQSCGDGIYANMIVFASGSPGDVHTVTITNITLPDGTQIQPTNNTYSITI